jgi:hypothetical protein
MGILVEIVPFGDPKMKNIFPRENGENSPPERGLEMGTKFYLNPAETLSSNILLKQHL